MMRCSLARPPSPMPSSTASSTTPTASTSPASRSESATNPRPSMAETKSERARPGGRVQGRLRRHARPQHRARAPARLMKGRAGAPDTPLHGKHGSLTLASGWPAASRNTSRETTTPTTGSGRDSASNRPQDRQVPQESRSNPVGTAVKCRRNHGQVLSETAVKYVGIRTPGNGAPARPSGTRAFRRPFRRGH